MTRQTRRRGPGRVSTPALFGLLTLAMFSSTFVVAGLSALGPLMTREMDLSGVEFGSLSSAVFLTAAIASPLAGRLADDLSESAAMTGLFMLSAVGIAAVASAPSYPLLLVAVGLCGLPMAAGIPATNALVSRQRTRGSQGWLVGVKQAGQPGTLILAGLLLPTLAATTSWRAALLVAVLFAAVGLLWSRRALVGVNQVRSRPKLRRRVSGSTPKHVQLLAGYSFLMGLGMSGVVTYLPLYAYDELRVSATAAGGVTGIIGITGLLARVVWGRVAERSRDGISPLTFIATGALLSIVGIMASGSDAIWLLWLGAAGFGATAHSWSGAGTMFLLRVTAPEDIGKASAVVQVTHFIGLTSSPLIVGFLKDATGQFSPAWAVVACAYVTALALSTIWLPRSTGSQPRP